MAGNAKNIGLLIVALDGQTSTTRAAEKAGMTLQSAMGYIRQWHRMGVCHIARIGPRAGDGRKTVALYKIGAGKDVRQPFKKPGEPKVWLSAVLTGILIEHLDGAHTVADLVDISGYSEPVLLRNLKVWHSLGAIYAAGWEEGRVGACARPLYALRRPGRPVVEPERPQKMSNYQRLREYRAKARARALNHLFAGRAAPQQSDSYREAA